VKQEVLDKFPGFTRPIEGNCLWMYLDNECFVTTADGNLIDPFGPNVIALPWQRGDDGPMADPHDVKAEWAHVKGCTAMCKQGGYAFKKVTSLRLSQAAVNALVNSEAQRMFGILLQRFPDAEQWPWQAQMGTLSMFWAAGPWMVFPKFEAAAKAQDWATCALECKLNATGNPGLIPRNNEDVVLFQEAGGDDNPYEPGAEVAP
jgi:hypothetical protein